MASIAIVRWRRNQRVPFILPVFILWPFMIVFLIVGFAMQLGSSRWEQRGKEIVLITQAVNALRGLRISLRDDESFLDIAVL